MSHKRTALRSLAIAASYLLASSASATVLVNWTDWTSISATSASGMMGGTSVTVTAGAINVANSQTGVGTNFWTEPNALDRPYTGGSVSNAPTAAEQVSLINATTVTVTFGSAVSSLYMGLLSVGQAPIPVTYDFNQAFTIDSEGQGFFGNDPANGVLGSGDTLTMAEFHGLLHFNNPVTSLTFTTAPGENWHAFTFAADVPEPGSLALIGLGLAGFGFSRRRKQKTA